MRLPEIVAKYGDVDVFGEALDQPKSLRKRGAALEQEPWPFGQAVEQGVERPADPEVLLGILRCRAETLCGGREEAGACVLVRCENLVQGHVHGSRVLSSSKGFRRSCIHDGR